jgi:hypothetical protein
MIRATHVRAARLLILLAVATTGLAACGSGSPTIITWTGAADTVVLYSASRPELASLPSAFDFVSGLPTRIDAPSTGANFDLVLADQGGTLVLVPNATIQARTVGAGVVAVSATFESLVEAPKDTTLYKKTGSFPVVPGAIYLVRSRDAGCSALGGGFFYAKVEALALNLTRGSATFRFVRNPTCDDRALIPKT